jgi:hypothetical protein
MIILADVASLRFGHEGPELPSPGSRLIQALQPTPILPKRPAERTGLAPGAPSRTHATPVTTPAALACFWRAHPDRFSRALQASALVTVAEIGQEWDKNTVHRLLTNVVYIGEVDYRGEIHDGEQQGIVDPRTFKKVGELLAGARCDRGGVALNEQGFLLRGLIRCRACGSVMTSGFSVAHSRQYRCYRCVTRD